MAADNRGRQSLPGTPAIERKDTTLEAPTLAERIESDLAAYDSVMTPDQVARVLHVTSKCVRDMCVDGRLQGSKAGKLWRIPKPALVDHLAGVRR